MRNLTWIPFIVLVAACGGELPKNQQPVTNCDTLDRASCSARTDCEVEALACSAVCQDDGHGGCVPCQDFRCIHRATPVACSALGATECTARSDCRLEQLSGDPAVGSSGAPHALALPTRCVDATPPSCEALDVNACSARSDCHVEPGATTTGFAAPCQQSCTTDSLGNQVCNCAGARPTTGRCVTNTPPSCEALDVNTCNTRPDCHVENGASDVACPVACTTDSQGNTVCSGGCLVPPPTGRCVTNAPPTCEQLDASTCSSRVGCALETPPCTPVCSTDSRGNTICTACDATPRCVTVQPVDICSGLDPASCSTHPECTVESLACAAVCLEDGTCPPCAAAQICVPLTPPSPCLGLDEVSCNADARCEFTVWACTQECRVDINGDGGCEPCVTPPSSCQERAPQPPVAGCGSGGQQPPGP